MVVLSPQEIVDQAVLEVRALRHKPKLEDISFTLRRGEVLGIAGLLGAGRSELLKAIVGLETYEQGEIVINGEKIMRPDYGDPKQDVFFYRQAWEKQRFLGNEINAQLMSMNWR